MAQPVPSNFSVRTRTLLLVPVRLFVGLTLLVQVHDQWQAGWLGADGLRQAWEPAVELMYCPWLERLLRHYVLPNSAASGGILMALEALVGVLLIVGLSVRLASLVGMVVTGVRFLVFGFGYQSLVPLVTPVGETGEVVGQGLQLHTEQFGLYGLMFLVLLAFFLTGAGKSFGLDGLVRRRRLRRLAELGEPTASSNYPGEP